MSKIKASARPAGANPDYRFFSNEETGHSFKAKQKLVENILGQPQLELSISDVGPDGKAILDVDGNVKLFWQTHVFTQAELTDPKFNPEGALAIVLNEAVDRKERDIVARNRLGEMSAKWNTDAPLALAAAPPAPVAPK